MQTHELLKKHSIGQHVQIVPTPSDREVVLAAQRRLIEDPGDVDALFAVAAWDEIVGDLVNALDLLNRLVSRTPEYPGVLWLPPGAFEDLGREREAGACERDARIYAETHV